MSDDIKKPGKTLKELLDPLGLQGIADLHKPFESFTSQLAKAAQQASEPLRMMQEALAAEARNAAKAFEKFDRGISLLAEQAAASTKLFDQIRQTIDSSAASQLQKQLADLVPPSAALLGAGFEKPGVLATLEDIPGMLGTVSWVEPEGIRSAGLGAPKADDGPRLTIEADIRCAICGEVMFVHQGSVEWKSAERTKVTMNVFPVCRRCVHEDDGSPGFWVEKFREMTRPRLKLITGGGEDPAAPGRDHLRLVERPEDEEP